MPYATVDADLVETLLASHPATRDELAAIRDPRNPVRYQGVYGHRHGGVLRGDSRYQVRAYRARVFKFWELGSGFDSPDSAARAVVAFYKCYFGADWRRAFRFRKVTPWRVRKSRHGYAADIYVRGKLVGVTHADAGPPGTGSRDLYYWPTAQDAKRAAHEAIRRRFERERKALPIPASGLVFWRA